MPVRERDERKLREEAKAMTTDSCDLEFTNEEYPEAPKFDDATWQEQGKQLGKFEADVKWDLAAWYAEWEARGKELAKRDTDVRWELGEWLAKGEPEYPEDRSCFPSFYTCAESITGLARTTLRDIASTYHRAVSVRTDAVSWSHHRVVINALPKADEATLKQWLELAAEEQMSVSALKEAIIKTKGWIRNPTLEKSFVVTIPLAVWETLKDFGDYEGITVKKMAARWLVETSSSGDKQSARSIAKKQTKIRRREKRVAAGKRLARNYPPSVLFGDRAVGCLLGRSM
jgi:hypothetical protein